MNTSIIFDSLLLISILSLIIERSLALIFEQKHIAEKIKGKGVKEIIAFVVCYAACNIWDIDVISSILQVSSKDFGIFLTAMAIAGGSKVSIKLFKDVMGVGVYNKNS